MAQDPYLQVENNTGLLLQRGGVTTLTSANLSVFSNLDIRDPQEVTFEVFLPPKRGALCFANGDCGTGKRADAISIFTLWDLVAGRLAYHHDGSSQELTDWFNVTAKAREKSNERQPDRGRREVHLDIGVPVKIYLESHQRQPTVMSNRVVVVEEGQNVSITREHLEASQITITPTSSNITHIYDWIISKSISDSYRLDLIQFKSINCVCFNIYIVPWSLFDFVFSYPQVIHEDSQPSEILFTVQGPPTLGFLHRQQNNGEQQLYQVRPTLTANCSRCIGSFLPCGCWKGS